MFAFDPPENIRKLLIFWCFQGDRMETLGGNGLMEELQKIVPMISDYVFTFNSFMTEVPIT